MNTMPAASPSRPSMRLIALASSTTPMTVTSGARSGDSTTNSEFANGTRKNSMVTPSSDSTLPLSTWPAILAGGDTGRMSSIAPTTNITAAASSSPTGSVLSVNISRNWSTCDATANATRKPDEHRRTAERRQRRRVHAARAGHRDGTDPWCCPPHHEGEEERDDRGDPRNEDVVGQELVRLLLEQVGVGREARAQVVDLLLHIIGNVVGDVLVARLAQHLGDQRRRSPPSPPRASLRS